MCRGVIANRAAPVGRGLRDKRNGGERVKVKKVGKQQKYFECRETSGNAKGVHPSGSLLTLTRGFSKDI